MNKETNITHRERDCVVTIHDHATGGFPLRLSQIAKAMQLRPPTVIEILKRLELKGYVNRAKGMVILTVAGNKLYSSVVNSHRILETMFVYSGIDLEVACKEVSTFDYMIDSASVKKLSAFVGNPKECPHGRPIG